MSSFSDEPLAGVFHDDAPGLEHVAVVGGGQRHVRVLLDQQDRGAALAVDPDDDVEDLARELGRQAQAGLVHQHHRGPRQQRACDRQHLLLAARKLARLLFRPFAQDREVTVDRLDVLRHPVRVFARIGAHAQVVLDRQQGKHLAALGHMADAGAHDAVRRAPLDLFPAQLHLAFRGIDDAGNGFQDGRLACPVGAEHGDDPALGHRERDPAQRLHRAVARFDVGQLEYRRAHAGWLTAAPPR